MLEQLGRELLGDGVGFGPEDPDRFRRFAERWIEQQLGDIRARICHHDDIRAIFQKDMQDRLNDFGTVADVLAGLRGNPPVTLLAIVLLRRGFETVCG